MKKIGFAFTFLLLITGCSSYNEETLQCNEVEYKLLGKGHGHDEFVESCIPDQSFRTDTALFCEFWSSANGTWYRCNLTQSLHSGHYRLGQEKAV